MKKMWITGLILQALFLIWDVFSPISLHTSLICLSISAVKLIFESTCLLSKNEYCKFVDLHGVVISLLFCIYFSGRIFQHLQYISITEKELFRLIALSFFIASFVKSRIASRKRHH